MHTRLLPIALLASAALAQNTVVSPVAVAASEGNSNNAFPFNSTVIRRYMQLHGDLGSTPLVITMLSFRVNAGTTNYAGTRAIDMELYMGDGGSATLPNFVYDNNYVTPKTLVIPRTVVNFGPTGQSVNPGPNPFTANMDLILQTPFVYTGVNSLVWEVIHYGTTTSGATSQLDADASTTTNGGSSVTGLGCIASGQTAAMTHTFVGADIAGTLVLIPTVATGPVNSLCFFAIGFTNPNLAFPGLCANVYTDAAITSLLGFTSATGAFTADDPAASFVVPNLLTGVQLFTQAFAFDALSPNPIQFAASNGRMLNVPASNFTRVNNTSRLWNNVGGTAATMAIMSTSSIGYGLATQFTHL